MAVAAAADVAVAVAVAAAVAVAVAVAVAGSCGCSISCRCSSRNDYSVNLRRYGNALDASFRNPSILYASWIYLSGIWNDQIKKRGKHRDEELT